jgi:tetratricopeptide (TPR) repeat protein
MGEADVTLASNKLAKAQEVAALKGLRAAIPFYVEATDALADEQRFDAAVGVLAEVLNARERKRSLFGSKEINPLGPDRAIVGKQFAKISREGQINDSLLELLSAIAVENPDDSDIRLANAEGLYRAGYMADAIDEYRYCEKLLPDDGALVARLGELYAIVSRSAEAVDHLRRGIGELMQAHHYDEVPFFALKLVDVEPQSANDIARWLDSMPEDAFQRQRDDIARLLKVVRDKGLDDGRWANLEQRLGSLPTGDYVHDQLKHVHGLGAPAAQEQAAAHEEPQAEALETEEDDEVDRPVWGSQTGPMATRHSAWDDVSNVEPASEDEMRMLLGPSAHEQSDENEAAEASMNGSSQASELEEEPHEASPAAAPSVPAAQRNGVAAARPSPASAQPASGASLPPGLAAFTRRKADTAFTAGDFAGAAQSYERLLKGGFDADVALPLLECYLGTERFEDAAALGLTLADHQSEAGDLDKALATLALVLEHTSDTDVQRRHSELLAASK